MYVLLKNKKKSPRPFLFPRSRIEASRATSGTERKKDGGL
jgi:hypothetical protein